MQFVSGAGSGQGGRPFCFFLRVSVNRPALRKRMNRLTVTVQNPTLKSVAGATVRVSGAGIKARKGKTSGKGKITFKIKPRKKGRLTFKATKSGYTAGSLTMRIA